MSPEVSSPEEPNVLYVLRPDSCSSVVSQFRLNCSIEKLTVVQVNGLYDASSEAARQRRLTSSGNHFQPRRRVVRIVPSEGIPDLQFKGKIVPIPLFAFSKAWRTANKPLIESNSHRIDLTATKPPDITHFLVKYSPPESSQGSQNNAPLLAPEVLRVDVTGNEEEGEGPLVEVDGMEGGGRNTEDGEEGYVGEDEEDENEEVEGKEVGEELFPRAVAKRELLV
jgi:hypothetical protein